MSDKSAIEWTDATWNPILGCIYVSQGCKNCYAVRSVNRVMGNPSVNKDGVLDGLVAKNASGRLHWTGNVALLPDRLDQPLQWKKPKRIFVNSMSDLFHEDVPGHFVANIFGAMAENQQHQFQVLTKRPEIMCELINDGQFYEAVEQYRHAHPERWAWLPDEMPWPLPNVWLGVSVENQRYANERIPLLLQTPAAARFISAEPLLRPLDVTKWLPCTQCFGQVIYEDYRDGTVCVCSKCLSYPSSLTGSRPLDWVIAGGESGPKARPMHPGWVRSLRDQCRASGVPFFFKQWGEWFPGTDNRTKHSGGAYLVRPTTRQANPFYYFPDSTEMDWVGKKAAGAVLDGQEHREFPEVKVFHSHL